MHHVLARSSGRQKDAQTCVCPGTVCDFAGREDVHVKWVLWKGWRQIPGGREWYPQWLLEPLPECLVRMLCVREHATQGRLRRLCPLTTCLLPVAVLRCLQGFSPKLPLAGVASWMSSSFLLDFDAASAYSSVSFSKKTAIQFLEFSSVPASKHNHFCRSMIQNKNKI